jgi:hypothetical protein
LTRSSVWSQSIGAAGILFPYSLLDRCSLTDVGRYKALLSIPRTPATPRPVKVTLPPVNLTDLARTYNNNSYGSFELHLISTKNPSASRSCQVLASNISTIVPSAIDSNIPAYIAEWNSPWVSHIWFKHFSENVFNVSLLSGYVS